MVDGAHDAVKGTGLSAEIVMGGTVCPVETERDHLDFGTFEVSEGF